MSFTYNSDLSSTLYKLRFLVQDTRDAGHFLEDGEITFIASTEPNLYRAAAVLCRTIAAKINRMPGFRDKQIFDPEKKSAEYRALAEDFDAKAEQSSTVSLTMPDMTPQGSNSSTSEPAFTRDLDLSDAEESAAETGD